jgi:hypothetical protein
MTFDPCSLPASKPVEIMDDLDALARLTARLENLERRVSTLEHPTETSVSVPAAPVKPATLQPNHEAFPFAQEGGAFPVLGKAMLGIAGAFQKCLSGRTAHASGAKARIFVGPWRHG